MSDKIVIELEEGKYEYLFENGVQTIRRHGEDLRIETGNSFILAMAMRIDELEKELDIAITAVEQCGVDYSEVTESLR
tara:strand:- start:5067 stop:5300 length:234 start_codon:yes stop_codon:yes gene_type:complete